MTILPGNPSFTGTSRYRIVGCLGQGSMGVVYEAHDLVLDRPVALKILHANDPENLYLLKQEFRTLEQLSHPNLVQLYELVVREDARFFTMELIPGTDLVSYVRAVDTPATGHVTGHRFERVRATLPQLVAGLGALHRSGTLHRDIKPSNILVEPSGRVVLLDFGLASNLLSHEQRESEAGVLAGTLLYMAPELIWGGPPTPAADWYSLGATLYEALTGRPPFDHQELLAVLDGRGRGLVSPLDLDPTIPGDLARLTVDLLAPDPRRRPTPEDVLARVASGADGSIAVGASYGIPARVPFVGRAAEVGRLRHAWSRSRASFVRVDITGPSGMGKTMLVEHFLTEIDGDDDLVLRARCHPRESIPFRAIDGLIDGLTRHLSRAGAEAPAAVLPANTAALVRVFPVLGRVPSVMERAASGEGAEPREVGRRAALALRELLGRVAARRTVVMWIDDVQWDDADSASLLADVLAPPDPPPLLLLLSFQSADHGRSEIARRLRSTVIGAPATPYETIVLRPLTTSESRRLAQVLLTHAACTPAQVDRIAAESQGSPFFATELARYAGTQRSTPADSDRLDLPAVIAKRLCNLPDAERLMLELIAVAGHPIGEPIVRRLLPAGADILSHLRYDGLVRSVALTEGLGVTVCHDRIREGVVGLLSQEARRERHRALAAAIESCPDPNPEHLVEHYLGADDPRRAGALAFAAAENAMATLAFQRAASLYRRALELRTATCAEWRLHARLGEALVNAGHGGEGARSLLAASRALAATAGDDLEVLRLRRRAADQLMRSGFHAEGLAVLRDVLSAAALPYAASQAGALCSLIAHRVRLGVRRMLGRSGAPRPLNARDRERLDICWSAGVGLAVFDPLRAADFHVRHALLAYDLRDPGHMARSLATESFILAWEGGRRKLARSVRREAAAASHVRHSGDANVAAHALVMRASTAFIERRYRECFSLCVEGEALVRDRCVGAAWELANFELLGGMALAYLGELARLREHLHRVVREAHDRGDQYCLIMARLGPLCFAWLAADQPEEGRRQVADALAGPFPSTFAWQIYHGAIAEAQISLYRNEATAAWSQLATAWRRLRRCHMLRLRAVRMEVRELRARTALALATVATRPADQRHWLGIVRREMRRIAREGASWSRPLVDALGAGLAMRMGDREAAEAALRRAASEFDRLDMSLHAAVARYGLGACLGGEAGQRLRAEQAEWMTTHGVANPARMVATLAPTFVETAAGAPQVSSRR